MKIYLASKSPRRQELLKQIGIEFAVLPFDIPELIAQGETATQYSTRVTQDKLRVGWGKILQDQRPQRPVLCADTEVVLDGEILGKPQNYQHAFEMLKKYSGRSHQVLTSVGMQYDTYQKILLNQTKVTFAPMTDADIHTYLATGDYEDKAGAYGIQTSIAQFICHIEGCFYSVMGLPLYLVHELMTDLRQQVTDFPA